MEPRMGLGAYSVVRYADDLGDQRLNLGVLVWHPVDGYRCRMSPAVDRVQAIDPRITIKPLKRQLEEIKESVSRAAPSQRELLDDLCQNFRHGLVISCPYPARISSAEETLERLYGLLVSPVPEFRRASSQRVFEGNVKKAVEAVWPKARIQQLGTKTIKGIPVNMGMRTQIQGGRAALWHSLSFQAEARPEGQMTSAKATVLDIFQSREIDAYSRDRQYVALQAPRAKSAVMFGEVVSCLRHAADEVYVANDEVSLLDAVQRGMRALENGVHHRSARS